MKRLVGLITMKMNRRIAGRVSAIAAAIGSLAASIIIIASYIYDTGSIFLIIGIIMFLWQSYIFIDIIRPKYSIIISCWLILINIAAAAGILSMVNYYGDYQDSRVKIETHRGIELPHNNISIRIAGKSVIIDNVRLARIAYTSSMIPTMYGGNTAMDSAYQYSGIKQDGICKDIRVGEIIVFRRGDDLIAHRVIDNSIGDGTLRTGADNAPPDYEEKVRCEEIMYKTMGILFT